MQQPQLGMLAFHTSCIKHLAQNTDAAQPLHRLHHEMPQTTALGEGTSILHHCPQLQRQTHRVAVPCVHGSSLQMPAADSYKDQCKTRAGRLHLFQKLNSRTCRTGLEGQQLAAYNSTARPADLAMLRCCPAFYSSAARLLTDTSLALQEVMQHRQLCPVNSSQTPDQAQKHPASPSTELPHPQRFFTLFSHTPRPQTPLEAHGVTLHRIAKGKPQLTATAFLQQCTQLAAHSSQHTALSAQVTATAFQHCTRSKPHRQQPPCCGKTNCKTHIHTSALPLPALQHA